MKKHLKVFLLSMMFSCSFAGILYAGQCVCVGNVGDNYYYYDSSSVKYSGNIVSYISYSNSDCEEDFLTYPVEIDCLSKLTRSQDPDTGEWTEWKSIGPGSPSDNTRIKLCR